MSVNTKQMTHNKIDQAKAVVDELQERVAELERDKKDLLKNTDRLFNEYTEKSKENVKLRDALCKVCEHGMPTLEAPQTTWMKCALSVHKIAQQALGETND